MNWKELDDPFDKVSEVFRIAEPHEQGHPWIVEVNYQGRWLRYVWAPDDLQVKMQEYIIRDIGTREQLQKEIAAKDEEIQRLKNLFVDLGKIAVQTPWDCAEVKSKVRDVCGKASGYHPTDFVVDLALKDQGSNVRKIAEEYLEALELDSEYCTDAEDKWRIDMNLERIRKILHEKEQPDQMGTPH